MNSSDNIEKIAAALVRAHASIGGVAKKASNPFFKSKYATLEAVVEAVKKPLLDQEIIVSQGVHDAEHGVAIETMLLHSSGQWISSTLRLPSSKEDAQGYGSAISYGRRYGLMAICGVPAEDDDGNAASASAKAGNDIQTPNHQSVTKDVWDQMTPAQQNSLTDIATLVIDYFKEGSDQKAFEYYEEKKSKLDPEEQIALWSRFNSTERTALKKLKKAWEEAEAKRKAA